MSERKREYLTPRTLTGFGSLLVCVAVVILQPCTGTIVLGFLVVAWAADALNDEDVKQARIRTRNRKLDG